MNEELHATKLYHPEMSPWNDLANAIIIRAATDYRACRKSLCFCDSVELIKIQRSLESIRIFFQSKWFETLSSTNGKAILATLDREVFEEYGCT